MHYVRIHVKLQTGKLINAHGRLPEANIFPLRYPCFGTPVGIESRHVWMVRDSRRKTVTLTLPDEARLPAFCRATE